MAKPNYAFEKRQRDLAKQRKKEDKRQRKAEKQSATAEQGADRETPPEIPESAAASASVADRTD